MKDSDSEIVQSEDGTITFIGPDASLLQKAIILKSSLLIYDRTGLLPFPEVNITTMLASVKMFSGKSYKRREVKQSIEDLEKWIDVMYSALPHQGF